MWIFGTSGLIKACLRTYFKARTKGLTEDQALSWVIRSRYPESETHRQRVAYNFSEGKDLHSEKERVKDLVFEIWSYEMDDDGDISLPISVVLGNKRLRKLDKARAQIDEIYESMRKKFKM